ncbi:ribulose-bisphosphate carboxylase large subunit family protein [Alicyclobacillus sp. SO9]|nr:ribulose-bisphosphate carboxylase large subunit family protein [Alicyclobacillus sp. SO9]QQE81407.1 ribulose-bisphosphate carboxylase large subunit family protein [Alicyclobacillus sp. SO9]
MKTQNRIYATYLIETPFTIDYAAEMIATEQSTGTFVAIPGETDDLKDRHRARVESVVELESVSTPSLPGTRLRTGGGAASYKRAKVQISFPFHNTGPSIPNLLATVCGNLYELSQLSGIRLIDLALPEAFADRYRGPQFGVDGTRKLCQVNDRPLIGTIVKPSIGLGPDELRALVRELAYSGIDFVKDDELNANPPYFPLRDRVRLVMEEVNRAAQDTGKQMMYAFNITDDLDRLVDHHDAVVEAGGNCVMVSINSVGLAGVAYLRRHSQVPIHGHRNQWGAMTRYPLLGMEFTAYQKLCRLAGVDHLHTNGVDNKFYESNESVVQSVRECLTPMYGGYTVMPVLSSGQWGGSAVRSFELMQTTDVLHLAGGGIMAHPDGVRAGVESMKQGWQAALEGRKLEDYARDHEALQRAVEKFGPRPLF